MKLSPEKRALLEKYPALAPFADANDIHGLRNLAKAIDKSIAAVAMPATTAKREPTTAELIAEASRLTREVAELTAQRQAPHEEVMHTGETRDAFLDREMGLSDRNPKGVQMQGVVQQFGVPVKGPR